MLLYFELFNKLVTNYSDYYTFNDWGNNSISNGGNIPNTWRTLSNDEWTYIFYSRNTNSGIRYAKARVNGINGIILLPDDWNSEIYNLNEINSDMANYSSNQISTNIWNSRFEANGAVYLPAACLRLWSFVYDIGLRGNYWSSTADFSDDEYSHLLWFDDSNIGASSWICSRTYGQSVRLVYDVE